jgi:hypothetical protein
MPTSLNGSTWLVLGIDDTTRIIFTGTYKSKTDVHQKIKDVVNLINNSRGAHTVKSVHSDNGGEFLGGGIQKWLTGLGIKHTTSAAYTPEHNGIAERALQTIVSMARCLLIASGLPLRFWAEAVRMAIIVYNMVPGAANNHVAPQYVWNKSIPDVSRLRTFRCKVLVKDPAKKLGKFVIRTWNGIYLGLADGGDGHRIYDPATKILNNSHDVFFLKDRGKPEFHSSPLIERTTSSYIEQGESQREEMLKAPFTLNVPNKGKLTGYSVYTERASMPPPPSPEEEDDEELTDARTRDRGEPEEENESEEETKDTPPGTPPESPQTDSLLSPTVPSPTESSTSPQPRRSTRTNLGKPGQPYWLVNMDKAMCAFAAVDSESVKEAAVSTTFKETVASPDRDKWISAMKEELESLRHHGTYKLTDLPSGRRAVGSKWVDKIKRDSEGKPIHYKARLVAQGFTQRKGLDFQETFAPVARMTSQRMVIATAAAEGLELFQIDVANAYLNGVIDAQIYMHQSTGFEDKRYPNSV